MLYISYFGSGWNGCFCNPVVPNTQYLRLRKIISKGQGSLTFASGHFIHIRSFSVFVSLLSKMSLVLKKKYQNLFFFSMLAFIKQA